MTLEAQVSALTTATTQLLSAVNVGKATLDERANTSVAQAAAAVASATAANTSAGASAGSAAQALAIYGSAALQQTAVAQAASQAAVAAGHAASAASVAQQDLSGVNAAALHRSPNAITSLFVYDTAKDSDGGAWRKRMADKSWMTEPLSGKWLGAQATEAAARAISGATTNDYFQLTTNGAFYKLNATSGSTETFRGNKAEFPALSAIVAEAGSVTIYDLTAPGNPMWMRFGVVGEASSPSRITALGGVTSISSVAAFNGRVLLGGSSVHASQAALVWEFTRDRFGNYSSSTTWVGWVLANLAQRNTLLPIELGSLPIIINSTVNAVAMTVLPDAPIDPVTGLQIPTIAVACGSGNAGAVGSVIMNNGTVVNYSQGNNDGVAVSFNSRNELAWGLSSASAVYIMALSTTAVASVATAARSYGITSFPAVGTSSTKRPTTGKVLGVRALSSPVPRIDFIRENPSAGTLGAVATITDTFNTGYMVGDIRRTLLADIGAGSVSAPELVTNGTFNTDTTGWSNSISSVIASVAGELRVTSVGAAYGQGNQSFAVVVGKTYTVSVDGYLGTANLAWTLLSNATFGGQQYGLIAFTTTTKTTKTISFVATASTLFVTNQTNNVGSDVTAFYDNISIKEVIADRSYKNKPANIFGTLTKSAVGVGSQLVAYSGFSPANYIQEPYSADLDFGTGAFTESVWLNAPVNTFGPHNLLSFPEDFTNSVWAKIFVAISGTGVLQSIARTSTVSSALCTFNSAQPIGAVVTAQIRVKKSTVGNLYALRVIGIYPDRADAVINLDTGAIAFVAGFTYTNVSATSAAQGDGSYILTLTATIANSAMAQVQHGPAAFANNSWEGNSATLVNAFSTAAQLNRGATATIYRPGLTAAYNAIAPILERSAATGPYYSIGLDGNGAIAAELFDGTTTRRVTSPATYNNGTANKARFRYAVDGALALDVNGVQVAVATGAPLLTMNNANAVLTVGNNFALNAPFPGSISLAKIGATSPTTEQAQWIYSQEKQMFADGAQVCLPDSGAVVDLAYDELTDRWTSVSATNEASFTGLVRTRTSAVTAGTYTKVAKAAGVRLVARATTTPGVDITAPAQGLKEELVRRNEAAAAATKTLTVFDFDAVAAQTDFVLPVGWTATGVLSAGASRREGATKDYTLLFDGFKETIRFAVAPGSAVWVRINARKA